MINIEEHLYITIDVLPQDVINKLYSDFSLASRIYKPKNLVSPIIATKKERSLTNTKTRSLSPQKSIFSEAYK